MGYDRTDRDRYENRNDRGFFDRAGDEVRSWFGDEEAERRRRIDERYDDRSDRGRGTGYGDPRGGDRGYAGYARSNRDDRGDYARGYPSRSHDQPEEGRQFDDVGATRSHYGYRAAHDADDRGRYARAQVIRDSHAGRDAGASGDHGWMDDDHGHGEGYRRWRSSQIEGFDRDYDEYRRENRARFQSEFATWRQNRQTQRDALGQVKEHHEVVGSDGLHVGTVDHVRADHLLLTKSDPGGGRAPPRHPLVLDRERRRHRAADQDRGRGQEPVARAGGARRAVRRRRPRGGWPAHRPRPQLLGHLLIRPARRAAPIDGAARRRQKRPWPSPPPAARRTTPRCIAAACCS